MGKKRGNKSEPINDDNDDTTAAATEEVNEEMMKRTKQEKKRRKKEDKKDKKKDKKKNGKRKRHEEEDQEKQEVTTGDESCQTKQDEDVKVVTTVSDDSGEMMMEEQEEDDSSKKKTNNAEEKTKKKNKKEKKKKKKDKKKKKNRKEQKNSTEDDDDEVQDDESKIVNLPKKKKRKRNDVINENQENTNGASSSSSSSKKVNQQGTATTTRTTRKGGIVQSSAIEYFDETFKAKVKKSKSSLSTTTTEEEEEQDFKSKLKQQQEHIVEKQQQQQQDDQRVLVQHQKIIDTKLQYKKSNHTISLLLFYQYVEPNWDDITYQLILDELQTIGIQLQLTGRMRVAKEGLNCTLTGYEYNIHKYCNYLQKIWFRKNDFQTTEFKITNDLPQAQAFSNLKVLQVIELVHYGLEGEKAPSIVQYSGTHLEPKEYHKKIAQSNTVIIDVRNHYEAAIGRFVPPTEQQQQQEEKDDFSKKSDHGGSHGKDGTKATTKTNKGQARTASSTSSEPPPKWLDPKMRKSTEFPVWLDKKETREQLKGKQVLMYCTGGIRCERASALLKYKMETDPDISSLNIKGVFQLQGGIDKYFKEFPDGGYWKGKNYVFDKRFAHAPPKIDAMIHGNKNENEDDDAVTTTTTTDTTSEKKKKNDVNDNNDDDDDRVEKRTSSPQNGEDDERTMSTSTTKMTLSSTTTMTMMGKCEACYKPWDMYRGKRRCPTCGVPSLICRECFMKERESKKGKSRNGKYSLKDVRCDLCVEQGIFSKRDLRQRESQEMKEYEQKMIQKGLQLPQKHKQQLLQQHGIGNEGQDEDYNNVNERIDNNTEGQGRRKTIADDDDNIENNNNEIIDDGHDDQQQQQQQQQQEDMIVQKFNPNQTTRLFFKNMCRKNMDETTLLEYFPNITHIVWNMKRNNGKGSNNGKGNLFFLGSAWIEMSTPYHAAMAVLQNGKYKIFNRPLYVSYQPADGKDVWPPPNSKVKL